MAVKKFNVPGSSEQTKNSFNWKKLRCKPTGAVKPCRVTIVFKKKCEPACIKNHGAAQLVDALTSALAFLQKLASAGDRRPPRLGPKGAVGLKVAVPADAGRSGPKGGDLPVWAEVGRRSCHGLAEAGEWAAA